MAAAYALTTGPRLSRRCGEMRKKGDALLFKGSRGMRMERALAWFLGEDVEE